jgi:O-methyltransferase
MLRSLAQKFFKLYVQPLTDPLARLPDIPEADRTVIRSALPFTMTSIERLAALCAATEYITRCKIPGDVVECGVWKGGSMLAAAQTLARLGDTARELYLYDTFEGMPPPAAVDVAAFTGERADKLLAGSTDKSDIRAYAPLEEAQKTLARSDYPASRIRFVKGRVEETIPQTAPERIALLRLDTDWYESTRHELQHLYPRLVPGGVLIIDDYGWWEGARRAVDEYIAENSLSILLNRIDLTGRIAVKI